MKIVIAVCCAMLFAMGAYGQPTKDPSSWTMKVVPGTGACDLVFHVDLQPGWHIWSLNPGGDGSLIPPSFSFDKGAYTIIGSVGEMGQQSERVMEGMDGKVRYFSGKAEFIQTVKARRGDIVKGSYTYQLCNETICLAPVTKPFQFRIP